MTLPFAQDQKIKSIELEPNHVYRVNGEVWPGVTTVLRVLDPTNMQFVGDEDLRFGQLVHLVTELNDIGELDEDTLDPMLRPYLDAWRAFCADAQVQWYEIEKRVAHPRFRYAGTLDRMGLAFGREVWLDIKTGPYERWHGPQVAAYLHAEREMAGALVRAKPTSSLMVVSLHNDGSYERVVPDEPQEQLFSVFCACLSIYNFINQPTRKK